MCGRSLFFTVSPKFPEGSRLFAGFGELSGKIASRLDCHRPGGGGLGPRPFRALRGDKAPRIGFYKTRRLLCCRLSRAYWLPPFPYLSLQP